MMYKQGNLSGPNQAPISAVIGSPIAGPGLSRTPPPPPPPPAQSYPTSSGKSSSGSRSSGLDILVLLLGVIAIIAVIGLIPLSVFIYRAYVPAVTAGTPPLPTLLPGQVRMPDVVGVEEATARATLDQLGLQMVVEGEEPHPTWPAFAIIRQSITPGAAIEAGSPISVVLSQGPSLIEVPDITGLTFTEAEQQLTALGMVVQKYEDWSVEPPGLVVGQDPPANSLIASRTLMTLFVSNGSRIPIRANLGGQISVEAYEIPRLQYKPGDSINLTFFWQALDPPTANYNVFIQLTTSQGGIVSEIDTIPQDGARPTNSWTPGDIIIDPYQLSVPSSTAPGTYQLRIGFYNNETNTRLPIIESGRGEQDNLGALILRAIDIVQ